MDFSNEHDDPDADRPEEAADRDLLVIASGIVTLPPRPTGVADDEEGDDDRDMARWPMPRHAHATVVATVELPARVIVCSPEWFDARHTYTFEPGTYEVVGIDGVPLSRLATPAVLIRRPDVRVASWRNLGMADDDNFAIVPAGADLKHLEYPGHPAGVDGAAEWIVPGKTTDGADCVWITNPSGNGIRAYGGVSVSGDVIAVVMQFY